MRIPVTALSASITLLLAGGSFAQEETKAKAEDASKKVEALPRPLNPNLAKIDELGKLSLLSEELCAKIVEKRPFLGMSKFDALIGDELSKEQKSELYAKVFIPLNLNAAPEEEILLVPGVGKKMAHEFDEYRPYKNLSQFRREIGKYVDEKEVARLESFVFIPADLNNASEDDFKTIPGVGKKMVHEFMEYRPYKNIEQFRREIGKYVDEKEVARLERYVFIKE